MGFPFMAYEGKLADQLRCTGTPTPSKRWTKLFARPRLKVRLRLRPSFCWRGRQEGTLNPHQTISELRVAIGFCKQHRFHQALA
jgi:hypothetical protein